MRRLRNEELEEVKSEFISYLILHGVDAEMWEEIKVTQQDKAELLIEKFSHQYFKVMLEGINYVTLKTEESIHSVNIRTKDASEFYWYHSNDTHLGYKIVKFKGERNRFIFDYLEKGYKPDKGEIYKELALIYANSKQN